MRFRKTNNAGAAPAARTVTVRTGSREPAVSLEKIQATAGVDLANKTRAAAVSLRKRGVLGTRFAVISVIDRSGSMHGMYRDGTVQAITERALGWTLAVDDDGNVPVGLYGSSFEWGCDVNMASYRGVVTREGWAAGGSTDLTGALRAARDLARGATDPVYLFVVTDGAPDDERSATAEIVAMASEPIFVKFLLVGDSRPGREYAQMLDDLETERGQRRCRSWGIPPRLVDNVDTKHVPDPATLDDDEFAEVMTDEVDGWLAAAAAAGMIR
jgi:hypothetical protein